MSVVLNIPTGIWTLVVLSDAGASGVDQLLVLAVAVVGHVGIILSLIPRIRRVVRA